MSVKLDDFLIENGLTKGFPERADIRENVRVFSKISPAYDAPLKGLNVRADTRDFDWERRGAKDALKGPKSLDFRRGGQAGEMNEKVAEIEFFMV